MFHWWCGNSMTPMGILMGHLVFGRVWGSVFWGPV